MRFLELMKLENFVNQLARICISLAFCMVYSRQIFCKDAAESLLCIMTVICYHFSMRIVLRSQNDNKIVQYEHVDDNENNHVVRKIILGEILRFF